MHDALRIYLLPLLSHAAKFTVGQRAQSETAGLHGLVVTIEHCGSRT
jgi:hypothetical protein